jgi:hypothetical protein
VRGSRQRRDLGSTRTYALAEGHGMDGTAALLVAMSLGGLLGAIISAWPAVAFFGAADMVLELVHRSRRRRRQARPAAAPAVPTDVQQAVHAAYLPSVQAGDPLSQRAMAARFGLSRRKIRQLAPESTASGHDHHGEGEAA